jgi:hypothetical protein
LKVILGGGAGDFFAVMALGLAILFILLGLGRERLTFAATFFFIVLRPYGPALKQRQNMAVEISSHPKQNHLLRGSSPLYAENCECVNCTRAGAEKLQYRFGMLQVHLLEFLPDDAIANHLRGPAFLRHFVGIQGFTQTCAAVGAMIAFETGTEAGVAVVAVTEAIARHLIQHVSRFFRGFVTFLLRGGGVTGVGQLLLTPDSGQNFSFGGRTFMKSRHVARSG